MAARRRVWDCSRAGQVVGVSFETLRAPKGALKRLTGCRSQRKIRQAAFTLSSDTRGTDQALRQRASVRKYPVEKAVNAEHDDEDDYDDGDEDDDDDDEGVTFLQWQMPSTPLNAEPVSDEDELYQFDTITAGNVPALFLGKAYTNAAVNIIGMHKMQKLLEDMYYHLVAPKPDQEAINTIGLLLRLCWMPHPHRSNTPTALYADTSTAVLDRGLDLDSHDIALKSIANTSATADATQDAHPTNLPSDPNPEASAPPRLPPLRAPLPPEGMQTLLSSCSRISGILLGLSSAVRDATPPPDSPEDAPGDGDGDQTDRTRRSDSQDGAAGDPGPSAKPDAHAAASPPRPGDSRHNAAGVSEYGRCDSDAQPMDHSDGRAAALHPADTPPDEHSTPSAREHGPIPAGALEDAGAAAAAKGAPWERGLRGAAHMADGSAGEEAGEPRSPPLLPGGVPAQASEAAEALSQHVRATAARMSEALEQMARLLAPTAIPLGLAVLCAQVLPRSMQFKPSPADEIALQHFAATPAGQAFRKQFNRNIAVDAAAASPAGGAAAPAGPAALAPNGYSAVSEPTAASSPSAAAAAGLENVEEEPEGGRAFRPLEWLQGRRDGDVGDWAKAAEQEDGLWPGKGSTAVNEMPVFFVPGVALSLPLQGHAVQFWPMFLSRMHLTSWVSQTHQALVAVWLARRRARRDRASTAAKARVARFFSWCRAASRGGRSRGGSGASASPDSDAVDGSMDDDTGGGGDEPAEVQELMDELAADGGLDGGPGGDSLVISISPSGFGKSVEYVVLGAAALVCGAAEAVAAAVDTAALATPGAKRMLGLCPEFEVQAARLGEVAAAGRAWNGAAAPFVERAMHERRDALEREVDDILRALSLALTDAVRSAADASASSRRAQSAASTAGLSSVRISVKVPQEASDNPDTGEHLGVSHPGTDPADSTAPGAPADIGSASQHRSAPPLASKPATTDPPNGSVDKHQLPGQWQRSPGGPAHEAGGHAPGDPGTPQQPLDSEPHIAKAATSPPPTARVAGDAGKPGAAGVAASSQPADAAQGRWWKPWTWRQQRRRRSVATGAPHRSSISGSGGPAATAQSCQPGGHHLGAAPTTPADESDAPEANDGGKQQCCAAGADAVEAGPRSDARGDADGRDTSDVVLPSAVLDQFRKVLRRVVAGVATDGRVQVRGTVAAAGSGDAEASGEAVSDAPAESGEADAAQIHSLRSGAEVDLAGAQIVQERAAALAAASASAPLHERLSDFLGAAIAERRALVENMLAARRSAQRGDVSVDTLRELRAAERRSRVSLMHTLHAMGDELAAAAGDVDSRTLRTMWLTTVNSLLAIDQASGLAPLLPPAAGTQVRVPQLRTAPATLDFLLAAASSLQAAARRDPRAFSLFLEPAASLVEARRSPALHAVLRHASGADAASGAASAHSVDGEGAAADGAEGVAEKLWRFSFDAVMPAAARLDAHSSVTIEVDLEQVFGAAPAEMLSPHLARVAASPPFSHPSFRGVLLVGDLDGSSTAAARGGVAPRTSNFEAHLGHLP